MFGAKSPDNSSLFGTPTPSQPSGSNSGGGLFANLGAGITPSPANTGSLFSTPGTATPRPGGGLFGTNPTAPAAGAGATTTGGGLFGTSSTPAANSTPATGGLFGTSAPAGNATGGLFGGNNQATTNPSAPATGGMYGSAAPATNNTPSTGGGMFGSAPAPTATMGTTGAGSSFFGGLGSTPQQQTQPKPSLFGTTNTPSASTPSAPRLGGLFGTNQTSNSTTQSQQQGGQSVVKVELYNLAPYHKFHELNDAFKFEVEAAEKYILSEIQKSEGLSAMFPEHREMVQSVRSDAELMERRLMTTNSFLQSDSAALESLMNHQKLDDQHASLSVRTLDLLRLPNASRLIQAQQTASSTQPGQNTSTPGPGASTAQPFGDAAFGPLPTLSSTNTSEIDITSNAGMINYFTRHGAEMESRLKQFLESVGEVEDSLRSVEVQAARKLASRGVLAESGGVSNSDGGDGGKQDEARRLNKALREFNEALSDTAVRVVDSKEGLRGLKTGGERGGQGGMGRSVRR